jgi:ELWxxDGT repeat protein/cysteine-rich repeat protein
VGARTFFGARNETQGVELWVSDGTTAGTVLVRDIWPGAESSSPRRLAGVGDVLYFIADDGVHGAEPWRSDGTMAGTYRIADIAPGAASIASNGAAAMGGIYYFLADDQVYGAELWRTDGTPAGTFLVRDIRPGAAGSTFGPLAVVHDRLYFVADDGVSGQEPWISDGTEAGTVLFQDLVPGSASQQFVADFTGDENFVFFTGRTLSTGVWNLWAAASGVPGGASIVYTSSASLSPNPIAMFGGRFLFSAWGPEGSELRSSDGTAMGTSLVRDINIGGNGVESNPLPHSPIALDDAVLFRGRDGRVGSELWRTDGTAAGTVLVRNLNGAASSLDFGFAGARLRSFALYRGFAAATGVELYRSDGTLGGTWQLADIRPGLGGSAPSGFGGNDHRVYLSADGPDGREPWISDGGRPPDSTRQLRDIHSGRGSFDIARPVVVGSQVFFVAVDGDSRELWRSDGTPAGTVRIFSPVPSSARLENPVATPVFLASAGTFFFAAPASTDGTLWASDGSVAGTVALASQSNYGSPCAEPTSGKVFMSARSASDEYELLVTDGTPAGTATIDIQSGSGSSDPRDLVALGGAIFFSAETSATGSELWTSDGTPGGTAIVADIVPGVVGSNPRLLTVAGSTLFFIASEPGVGREVWISDGTTAGTTLVQDSVPGPAGLSVGQMTAIGGRVFFDGDAGSGPALWTSDGTAPGTFEIINIQPGSGNPFPLDWQMQEVGGRALFLGTSTGLWVSDGTLAGTMNLLPDAREIDPAGGIAFVSVRNGSGLDLWATDGTPGGTTSLGVSVLGSVVTAGGKAFFASDDGVSGAEMWISDGTAAGTSRLAEVISGSGSPTPDPLAIAGSRLFFAGHDGLDGRQLWAIDGLADCGNGVLDAGETCDDGNLVNGDGCDANCRATGCGNGIVTAGEECDDGNAVDDDSCRNGCVLNVCGDGVTHAGVEACDDGNATDTDACGNDCTLRCGDGVVQGAEECDSGQGNGSDGCCSSTCALLDDDGDGVCDAYDPCPHVAGASPAPLSVSKAILGYRKTGPGLGDDQPKVARAEFSTALAFDPAAGDPVHVLFRDGGSGETLLTTTLSPSLWTRPNPIRKAWVYVDRATPSAAGIRRATLRETPAGSNLYRLSLRGKDATFVWSLGGYGLRLVVEIAAGASGECFAATVASCSFRGTRHICKP